MRDPWILGRDPTLQQLQGMREEGTTARRNRPENTLDRQFEQAKPRAAFVTDVTYIPVKEGWLHVSPVMDLCTREIVV